MDVSLDFLRNAMLILINMARYNSQPTACSAVPGCLSLHTALLMHLGPNQHPGLLSQL